MLDEQIICKCKRTSMDEGLRIGDVYKTLVAGLEGDLMDGMFESYHNYKISDANSPENRIEIMSCYSDDDGTSLHSLEKSVICNNHDDSSFDFIIHYGLSFKKTGGCLGLVVSGEGRDTDRLSCVANPLDRKDSPYLDILKVEISLSDAGLLSYDEKAGILFDSFKQLYLIP